jgi:hypothetical protein
MIAFTKANGNQTIKMEKATNSSKTDAFIKDIILMENPKEWESTSGLTENFIKDNG